MNKLFALLIFLPGTFANFAQMPMGGITGGSGAPCNPPTMTSRWAAYNSSNLCTGSVACTNGASVTSVPDFLGANSSTSVGGITYATGSVNGLPSFSLPASTAQIILPSAGTVATSGSITLYAVLNPSSTSANGAIIGSGLGSGPEWRIAGGGKQEYLSQATTSIGTSTSTVPTASYSTIAMTYVYSTGVLTFYKCASGTCSIDGTVTKTASFTNRQNVIGFASVVNEQFLGNIAEVGYLNSASVTGIAAWSQCKYGI